MSLFSKATKGVSKLANNKLIQTAASFIPGGSVAVGTIATAAKSVAAIKADKGQSATKSIAQPTSQAAPSAKAVATNGGLTKEPSFFQKAWAWIMANKKNVLIVAAVLVVMVFVYVFMFAKKGVRRRSPRRVSQAARMRAAKAAKRKR